MLPSFVTAHRNASPPGPWILRTELGGSHAVALGHVKTLRKLGYEAQVVRLLPVCDTYTEAPMSSLVHTDPEAAAKTPIPEEKKNGTEQNPPETESPEGKGCTDANANSGPGGGPVQNA